MQKQIPSVNKYKLKISVDEDYALVRLVGSIEGVSLASNETVKVAIRTNRRMLLIDLTKCYSLHPDALKWLEQLSAYADSVNVRLRLIASKGTKVYRLLKLMRYDRFMTIVESIDEALSYSKHVFLKDKSRYLGK